MNLKFCYICIVNINLSINLKKHVFMYKPSSWNGKFVNSPYARDRARVWPIEAH